MTPTQPILPFPALCICGDPACAILYGYCHCNCGNLTKIAETNINSKGVEKGKPRKFLHGHNASINAKEKFPEGLCVCGDKECDIPYGFCHCRCGGLTTINKHSNVNRGMIGGMPQKFIRNHTNTREVFEEIEIDGEKCRYIGLTQGQKTLVSSADYAGLVKWNWYAKWSKETKNFYAVRRTCVAGKILQIPMHRHILGLPPGRSYTADHVNPDKTLDNRRSTQIKTWPSIG